MARKRSAQSERRAAALAALMQEHRAEPDDYDAGEEEDVRPYLTGRRAPRRFVCVTEHNDKPFFLPTFDDAETAQARAVEYMYDDLFAEIPVAVVDLDTGERYYPEPWAMPWRVEGADTEARGAGGSAGGPS